MINAYERLKLHLGYDIPELKKHVGLENSTESGSAAFVPGGKIVIGAYREDHEDIVFNHTYDLHSCTHFWKPDNGDGETWNYLLTMWENAFNKANKFIYGGYTLAVPEGSNTNLYLAPTNLFTYYKNGQIYHVGTKIGGQVFPINSWITHSQAERDRIVWEIIGRVAHLLADVNTPAHVKQDPHPSFNDPDSYEEWMAINCYAFNYNTAVSSGTLVPTSVTHPSYVTNTLKNLFYTSAQIADHFNSDDEPGNNGNGINDAFTYYYTSTTGFLESLQIKINNLPSVDYSWPYSVNISQTASICYNYSINATASLLLWCAHEMDILPRLVPQQYPTLQAALVNAHSGQPIYVMSGSCSVTSNLTIPEGIDVYLFPNVSMSVSNNVTMTINGSLNSTNAIFTSGNGTSIVINGAFNNTNTTINLGSGISLSIIGELNSLNSTYTFGSNSTCYISGAITGCPLSHFQGNGTMGSWNGFVVQNNNSASVQYCNIKDADNGIRVQNSNPGMIWSNYIRNCNRGMDYVGYSAGPMLRYNKFIGNPYDVYGDQYAVPYLGQNNDIIPGWNSFRDDGTEIYNIYSNNSGSTITAGGNYFQVGATVTQNVNASYVLSYDPNPKLNNPENGSPAFPSYKKLADGTESNPPGFEELNAAYIYYAEKKDEEAKKAYEEIIAKYPDEEASRRALAFLEHVTERMGKSVSLLLEDVTNTFKGKPISEFASYRKMYQSIKSGKYEDAARIALASSPEKSNSKFEPYKLYDLGLLYWYYMGQKEEGKVYFTELIAKFPEHDLSSSARKYLGIGKDKKIETKETVPGETILYANYPNPFNPATTIKYNVSENTDVSLKVFDVLGREVKTLVNGFKQKGSYEVKFEAAGLASGLYFYQLKAGKVNQIMKMVLAK